MGWQHDGVSERSTDAPQQPSPEEDAATARSALLQGDVKHCLHHLSPALVADPTRTDWLALLEQAIAKAGPDPLALVPLTEHIYIGTVLIRAYIDAYRGKLDEAVNLLLQAWQSQTEKPYIVWLERWRALPGFGEALAPRYVIGACVKLVSGAPEFKWNRSGDHTALENAVTLLTLATEVHPEETFLWFFRCIALRKLGRFDEALHVGAEGLLRSPSYHVEVALAGAYRHSGRYSEAVEHFKASLRYEDAIAGARNDIADCLGYMGRLNEAESWYKEMLRFAPDDAWAMPSSLYYWDLLQPGTGGGDKLRDYAREHRENERAQVLVQRIDDLEARYRTRLPQAPEAIINATRQLVQRLKPTESGTINVALSQLESPSARLAVELQVALMAPKALLNFTVGAAPTPDTRQPLRPVDYLVWRYEEMAPMPNVEPPSPEIAEEIARIARQPFGMESWREQAQALAERLGPSAVLDLLGVLVHAPMPPQGVPMWDWMRQVQMASVLTLAQIDSGWEGSLRRRALLSLAYGPMDWTGEMAIVAMTDLGCRDDAIGQEAAAVCGDLWRTQSNARDWALWKPVLFGMMRLPQSSAETRQWAREALGTIHDS